MLPQKLMRRRFPALVCVALSPILVTPAVAEQRVVPSNMFTASGFIVKFADTPEKIAVMRSLPTDKLVIRKRAGKTYYVYADPNGCVCAFVGNPEAYAMYQNGGIAPASALGGGPPSIAEQMFDESSAEDAPSMPGTESAMDYIFGRDNE